MSTDSSPYYDVKGSCRILYATEGIKDSIDNPSLLLKQIGYIFSIVYQHNKQQKASQNELPQIVQTVQKDPT